MNNLPKGWTETTLGEVCQKIGDGLHGTPKYSINGDYFFINGNNLIDGKIVFKADTKKINKIEFDKHKKSLGKNTVLISINGTIGKLAKYNNEKCILGKSAGYLNVKNNTSVDFIYYIMLDSKFQNDISKNANICTIKNVSLAQLREYIVSLPLPKEQKAIADILLSFDNKIELLNEQNKTLETMAQAIFKEWFVKFNYPNATGEMIDSEIGKIPKDWKIFELEELVNTINGYSYKGKELVEQSNEALVTLKSFNRNGGFQTRGFKPFKGTPKVQHEVVIGDLIVAHTDLTQDAEVLGNPAFIFENGGFYKMYITMDLVKIISKINNIDNAFLYYIMKDRRFKGHCVGYSNGTTVLHLSKKAIPEYKIALPMDLKFTKEFSYLAYSFTNKISNNITQIQALQNTRDTLLPKLMSGKLRVKGFEN
jgi:type I restriction enzyme S subunit